MKPDILMCSTLGFLYTHTPLLSSIACNTIYFLFSISSPDLFPAMRLPNGIRSCFTFTYFCFTVRHDSSAFTTTCYLTNYLLFIIHMLMCTSPPCSLQSLSCDLLNKMSTSLAQNKTMTKLALQGYRLTQVEEVNLFMHYLLLGLSSNTTVTDLTLDVPHQCWDWPQGIS